MTTTTSFRDTEPFSRLTLLSGFFLSNKDGEQLAIKVGKTSYITAGPKPTKARIKPKTQIGLLSDDDDSSITLFSDLTVFPTPKETVAIKGKKAEKVVNQEDQPWPYGKALPSVPSKLPAGTGEATKQARTKNKSPISKKAVGKTAAKKPSK